MSDEEIFANRESGVEEDGSIQHLYPISAKVVMFCEGTVSSHVVLRHLLALIYDL